MDGMRIVVPVHFHGTMAADGSFRWKVPGPLTLVHVSAVASNAASTQIKLGTTVDDDGYLTAAAVGQSGAPAVFDRGDFNGALNADTAECPHLDAGTVLLLTVDFDGAAGTAGQNVSVVVTLLEG